MMRKFLTLSLLTIVFGLGNLDVFAAPKDDPAAKLPFNKKMKWANALFRDGSFYNAEDYFKQLKKEQPRNPYLAYMIAECAAKNRDYPAAAESYKEAYELAPELYFSAVWKQALMRKSDGQYENAIQNFEFYIKNYKGRNKKMKVYAKREIEGCQMAMKSAMSPERAFVKNAGPNVNTAYTELSPYPLSDTALMFGTMSSNKIIDVTRDKRADYVSRLMWSPKEFDRTRVKDSFEVSMKFNDGKFNDPKMHVGNGSWAPGGTRFYFTKCLENPMDTLGIICKIYVAEFNKKTGQWDLPKLIDPASEINAEASSNTQPFCAMLGKKEVLFFSSNRKQGSAGGFDIWYSVYDSARKTYRRPQNVGKKINTWANEGTPYYDSRKGKLYFSSNGQVNFGGYDIYSANGGPSRYTEIKNLGFPINGPADDLYYIQDPGPKDNAYIVSNRMGSYYVKNPTCCDDIWRVIKEPSFYVKGVVIDEVSNEPIPEVVVKMTDEGAKVLKDTNFSKQGNFMFYTPMGKNYTITADKQGYISGRTTVSTAGKSVIDPDDTTFVTLYMHKIRKYEEFHVQNVYYDFTKSDFQPTSFQPLDSLVAFMTDNPAVSVEIRSYTDAKGDDESNDKLSVRRAEAVMRYLETKGVDRGRMVAIGGGEKNPLEPNEIEGKDNPTGRQMNRRTEFRIIGDTPDLHIIYDRNRPEYIDKSGTDERNKNLLLNPDENEDDVKPDTDTQVGSGVN
jgi:outer membrane protein OmpA-like peptidoglycan-associated protein/tetratricopeptide (TPR) repeat protein